MGKITVVGVGYEADDLTLGAVKALGSGARIILHTGRCGCADWLREKRIDFETLDGLYETSEDFDEHAQRAAEAVRAMADAEDVVYGVFDVRDRSVAALGDVDVRVIAGPPVEGVLFSRAVGQVQMLEAADWEEYRLSSGRGTLVRELDSRQLAGEVKLKLMEVYPEERQVWVGFGQGGWTKTELFNLDRLSRYDHRTCVFVPKVEALTELQRYDFDRFCQLIHRLCGPDGCPWDRIQTHQSLRPFIVEEAYEVVGAIDSGEEWKIYDELGDMLLQVVLHAEIGRKHGEFDISDVITAISEKLIFRHSHLFGGDHAESAGEVLALWSKRKMAERGELSMKESMEGITRSLPATLRACKVLKRLEEALRRKESPEEARRAVLAALETASDDPSSEQAMGATLLQLIGMCRAGGIDPEIALNGAVDRLIGRFGSVEKSAADQGYILEEMTPEVLKKYWEFVKLLR
ncbi:MAG: MazG family protein [Christensenellales bacterium]|nr:MazG family protein [Christensenellales bacterium]